MTMILEIKNGYGDLCFAFRALILEDRPSEKATLGARAIRWTTGRSGERTTNLSAVDESVPSGHPVGHPPGIGGAAGGRGHPDGKLVGIMFGVGRGGDRGDHQQRDQRRRRFGAAAVDGVRRHRRAVRYCWWRSRRLPASRPIRGRRRCRRGALLGWPPPPPPPPPVPLLPIKHSYPVWSHADPYPAPSSCSPTDTTTVTKLRWRLRLVRRKDAARRGRIVRRKRLNTIRAQCTGSIWREWERGKGLAWNYILRRFSRKTWKIEKKKKSLNAKALLSYNICIEKKFFFFFTYT